MKKIIFVVSALLLSAGLSFGQTQQSQNNAKPVTKTEIKKHNNTENAPIAKRTHMKKSATMKKAPKK